MGAGAKGQYVDEDLDEDLYFGFTAELIDHKELLREALEAHREGFDDEVVDHDEDELVLEEKKVYPPTAALWSRRPPPVTQGPSGWIYHSTSLGCLRPHHLPRRIAIVVIESSLFDPLILLTIMCNCSTMAWSSPLDEPGTWKQDVLAVRIRRECPTVSPSLLRL